MMSDALPKRYVAGGGYYMLKIIFAGSFPGEAELAYKHHSLRG